jgi:hypothetical protein
MGGRRESGNMQLRVWVDECIHTLQMCFKLKSVIHPQMVRSSRIMPHRLHLTLLSMRHKTMPRGNHMIAAMIPKSVSGGMWVEVFNI